MILNDPRALLQTYHKNCMYRTEKTFHEVSTQCQNSSHTCTDEQTQVSQSNESKNTQTSVKDHRQVTSSKSTDSQLLVNPYAIIDRVNQGEQFLRFLSKQNIKLDAIYTHFLEHLQKYTDNFLLSLQQEHGSYGIYRQDIIRYMLILQEQINELQTKVVILREANKNFSSFQKHFHKIIHSKSELEDLLHKHEKHFKHIFSPKESVKYQQQFFDTYQRSYAQLRTIEQQRLLTIREQMRFAMNLTLNTTDNHRHLFVANNFDELLQVWDEQHTISLNHWSHLSRRSLHRSQHDTSLMILDQIKQVADDQSLKRIDSITTHSYI